MCKRRFGRPACSSRLAVALGTRPFEDGRLTDALRWAQIAETLLETTRRASFSVLGLLGQTRLCRSEAAVNRALSTALGEGPKVDERPAARYFSDAEICLSTPSFDAVGSAAFEAFIARKAACDALRAHVETVRSFAGDAGDVCVCLSLFTARMLWVEARSPFFGRRVRGASAMR
jgi:hypothetical protein